MKLGILTGLRKATWGDMVSREFETSFKMEMITICVVISVGSRDGIYMFISLEFDNGKLIWTWFVNDLSHSQSFSCPEALFP